MKIQIKNTFLSFDTTTPDVGMIKSSSCSNMAEMEEKIRQGERSPLKARDISSPSDTDTGESSGELVSTESASISIRRRWDEYSMEGDNNADSALAEINDVPETAHQCYLSQNVEVNTNWFPQTVWPHDNYGYEYPSQMLGRVPRGAGREIVPGLQQQVDKRLVPNTESTPLRRPAGSGKRKGNKRKRRNRWVYGNRKNRVTLLVDPWNDLPVAECIEEFIGTDGHHIKALTECYDGAFVRVEEAAYPSVHAYGSTMSSLMSVQISAPYVSSFLKCRERTLEWIYALFPAAVVGESEEGMVIQSFSMHV